MSAWGRLAMATSLAAKTFWRTLTDPPGTMVARDWGNQLAHYEHLHSLYSNDKFENLATWAMYKSTHGLGRHARMIYNPVRRLVDFYAGIIYPGVLSEDGRSLPDSVRLAIPLADDTPAEIRTGLGQLWQWSNWQEKKTVLPQQGAIYGNAFVEIVDDLDNGIVRMEIRSLADLCDLEVDDVGDVKMYAYEYDTDDDYEKSVTYKRQVDEKWIREFRDDTEIRATRNPYGFAPAIWCPHFATGSMYGSPAVRNIAKLDELNNTASYLSDKVNILLKSPVVFWGGNGIGALFGNSKAVGTSSKDDSNEDREKLKILQGPAGGKIDSISPEGIDQVLLWLDKLIAEVEADHPELTMYQELRAMTQITGPAAERLLGDAAALIDQARSNYDHHSRKLFQMALAIGGWRANDGGWGDSLTRQQAKFKPFNLLSYQQGDLNFDIMPRPIVPETPREKIERERMEVSLEADRTAGQNPLGIEQRLRGLAGEVTSNG